MPVIVSGHVAETIKRSVDEALAMAAFRIDAIVPWSQTALYERVKATMFSKTT